MKQKDLKVHLRQLPEAGLEKSLEDERKNLFMGRKEFSTGNLENPRKLRASRKNIARILTIQKERELDSAKGTK